MAEKVRVVDGYAATRHQRAGVDHLEDAMTAVPGFDNYTLRARLLPAILVATPLLALGVAALPVLGGVQKLWSMASLAVLTFAALLSRKAGDGVQDNLWETWGGAPTVRRYADAADEAVVTRRHRAVEAILGRDLTLPDAVAEAADPGRADFAYQDAARRLIAQVRNRSDYGLLNAENRNYGFARNLYGLRGLARAIAAVTLLVSLVAALLVGLSQTWGTALPLVLPLIVSAAALLLWREVDPMFVKPSAEAYADRLMEVLDHPPR